LSRYTLLKLVAAVSVVAAIALGLVVLRSRAAPADDPAAHAPVSVQTTPVLKTDLSDSQVLPGTLGFGSQTPVSGRGAGVVTQLPTVGKVTARGRSLYRVDDQPVPVFYGSTPLFRTLRRPKIPEPLTGKPVSPTEDPASGISSAPPTTRPPAPPIPPPLRGRDVTVVVDNLRALGYDIGVQPSSGTGVYTKSMAAAVKRWQNDVGMKATGTLGVGQVVVLPGPGRVSSVEAQLGDPAEGPLLNLTSTTRTVSVPVDAGAVNGIKVGARATVVLPDTKEIKARVSAISRSIPTGQGANPGAENSPPTLTIRVQPLRAADVAKLDSAPVQVRFSSALRQGVLAVPVAALLALSGGGYALQRADGSLIAVETGLFADGLVEVSGDGLAAGLPVQTAS
jgi:peptidoglycan hydrolase-like protein with peptidoglycan-binding domain